jgi:hypothetical protein
LRPERPRGLNDCAHLLVGEMLLEPARLLRQDTARGSDLDDVGAGLGELADAAAHSRGPVQVLAGRVRR